MTKRYFGLNMKKIYIGKADQSCMNSSLWALNDQDYGLKQSDHKINFNSEYNRRTTKEKGKTSSRDILKFIQELNEDAHDPED